MTSGPQYPQYPGDDPGDQPRPAGSPPPPPPPMPGQAAPGQYPPPPAVPGMYPDSGQYPPPHTVPGHPGGGRELAGWWMRVAAYLVDGLVLFAVGIVPFVVGMVVLFSGADVDPVTDEITGFNAAGVPILVLGAVLYLGFDIWNRIFRQGRTGRSIGKSAVGLRLVDAGHGEPIGTGAAAARWGVALLIGFVPCGGLIDVLWPLWDEKNQTLHDKTVNSVVVRD